MTSEITVDYDKGIKSAVEKELSDLRVPSDLLDQLRQMARMSVEELGITEADEVLDIVKNAFDEYKETHPELPKKEEPKEEPKKEEPKIEKKADQKKEQKKEKKEEPKRSLKRSLIRSIKKSPVRPIIRSFGKSCSPSKSWSDSDEERDEETRDEDNPDLVILKIDKRGSYEAFLFTKFKAVENELDSQSIFEWKSGPLLRNPVYKLPLDTDYWIDNESKNKLDHFNTFILQYIDTKEIGGYDDIESEKHKIYKLVPTHRSHFDSRTKIKLGTAPFVPNVSEDMNRYFFVDCMPKNIPLKGNNVYFGGIKNGKPHGAGIECSKRGYKIGQWKEGEMVDEISLLKNDL
jgi:hypothetical protein